MSVHASEIEVWGTCWKHTDKGALGTQVTEISQAAKGMPAALRVLEARVRDPVWPSMVGGCDQSILQGGAQSEVPQEGDKP